MTSLKQLLTVSLLLLLVGCAYLSTGVQRAKDTADAAAQVEIMVPCAMTVGAFYRSISDRQRLGVYLLCDPDAVVPSIREIDDAEGN